MVQPVSRDHRWLKTLVVVMGILIVVGLVVVLVELGRRMFTPKPPPAEIAGVNEVGRPPAVPPPAGPGPRGFGPVDVAIPAGAEIVSMSAAGDRLVVHLRLRDGRSVGYVVDPVNGALLGTLRFPATRAAE